jgi:hypothetical protein
MSRRTNSLVDPAASRVCVGEAVSFPGDDGAMLTSHALAQETPRVQREPFPATMPLGQFLFEYLYRRGVRHSFGLPGDFALPTFTWLESRKSRASP